MYLQLICYVLCVLDYIDDWHVLTLCVPWFWCGCAGQSTLPARSWLQCPGARCWCPRRWSWYLFFCSQLAAARPRTEVLMDGSGSGTLATSRGYSVHRDSSCFTITQTKPLLRISLYHPLSNFKHLSMFLKKLPPPHYMLTLVHTSCLLTPNCRCWWSCSSSFLWYSNGMPQVVVAVSIFITKAKGELSVRWRFQLSIERARQIFILNPF